MKKTFYREAAYVLGIIFIALGTSFFELAGFGMSMVVAPAYIIHLAVSEYLPFFTFGMAEYTFQALLIILLMIVLRKLRWGYLFSFVTAVLYGFTLDGFLYLGNFISSELMALRILYFILGTVICSVGVAMHFKTYISPEAYELVVKEIAEKKGIKTHTVKLIYDMSSLVLAIVLSFVFFGFGNFKGIGVGTVICAFLNGHCIEFASRLMDSKFEYKDWLNLRKIFEK